MARELQALLESLSTRQKAALTAGADYWRTVALPEVGIGSIKFTDGPIGARGDLGSGTTSTCFPCGSALGATWDPDLAREFGRALAAETRAKGAQVLLAPTVNLHRHPLAGRNFECMSEDPELTARLCSALIQGLQSEGIGASLKHFVANDQETERMSISAEVDERTLRELYLRPFEAAVATADPWTIMAAYNRVNGDYATESHRLLTEILKTEWGWQGMVISDWWATHDTGRAAGAGLDLEMPGPAAWLGDKLADAVEAGEVSGDVLDGMALRILRLLDRAGYLEPTAGEAPEGSEEFPESREVALRIATQGTVLLTNGRGLLPLDSTELTSVAVIGPAAHPGFEQGGGSSLVWPHRRISPLDGLRDALPAVAITSARGCALGKFAPPIDPELLDGGGWSVRFWSGAAVGDAVYAGTWPDVRYSFLGRKIPGIANPSPMSAEVSATFTPDQSGPWRFQLASAGRAVVSVDGEKVLQHTEDGPVFALFPDVLPTHQAEVELLAGVPVEISATLTVDTPGVLPQFHVGALAPDPRAEIDRAAAMARAADVAVLVVGTGPEFESEGLDRTTLDLPGAQNELIEAVLAAQPNTVVVVTAGAPIVMPWLDRAPAVVWGWFAGQEAGHALADVLLGSSDPGGRLPTTFPSRIEDTPAYSTHPGEAGAIRYLEGPFIGYRWYDARDVKPAFPFGHGLSYAQIEFGSATATLLDDGGVNVVLEVRNTSPRAGTEVVQVYVDAPAAPVQCAPWQLAAFGRVFLEAGAKTQLELTVPPRAFAFWDVRDSSWSVPAGPRVLRVGRSSSDVQHHVTVDMPALRLSTPQP